ncbi:winged helix-turn-helix domain-containing protein [Pseudoxanthomonas beigongshangi]|uniref:winged helix-turn-helix domain-containing protein n=1 Tax=Pseudoxanthomonas beigongshangi TaxID=2782537 RepID=UPI00193C47A8|nr:winged helix-turn-helix transcriptional regulator [Pseudoxanthomonas beigongshangi]
MGDPTRFRLEDLAIDLERQRVERAGEVLNVAGLSFQLLRYLVLQGDRVVGFDELIERVWAPAVVNEETVTQRVKLLRQALGDDGRQPRYLRSVRGQGYQLCARPQPLDDDVEPVPKASFAASRRWSRAAVAVVVVTAVAVGLAIAWTAGDAEKTKTNAMASSVPSGASGTASLIERADYYAGIGQRDNNERAIELYERALQEQPDNARALVGLSRSYGARVCLFNFPPEWAARAQQLAERVIHAHPDQAAAYAALGYSHDCRGRIDEALAGYERAVALDPAADGSRASAAYLYDRKGRLADALIANTSLRGDPARVRFLQLQIANNLDLLGYPQAAETRYRQSFELYPDNVFSNLAWPRYLFRHGRLSEAQAALDVAQKRGTAHADLHLLAAELARLQGDAATATGAYQEAVALRPQSSLPTTLARIDAGRVDAAWARARAETLAAELDAGAGYPSDWLEVALLRDAGGDRAAALRALQRAIDAGYSDADYLQVSPLFKPMADEPAFARGIDAIHRHNAAERAKVPPALLVRLTASP